MKPTCALKAVIILSVLCLSGCRSRGLDRLLGTEEKEKPREMQFYVVACCRDNDGSNNLTYPSFLPAEHIQLCEAVRQANHRDEPYQGDMYLASNVDCGKWGNKIGDPYYAGKGY